MRSPVVFNVPGAPVPKGRPRHGANGNTYTPARTLQYESEIGWAWKRTGAPPFTGPVAITISVYEEGAHPADWDNYAKVVCDALNTLAFDDDRQIERAVVNVVRKKPHSLYGAGIDVTVEPLPRAGALAARGKPSVAGGVGVRSGEP